VVIEDWTIRGRSGVEAGPEEKKVKKYVFNCVFLCHFRQERAKSIKNVSEAFEGHP
jgi:hypothetical protein